LVGAAAFGMLDSSHRIAIRKIFVMSSSCRREDQADLGDPSVLLSLSHGHAVALESLFVSVDPVGKRLVPVDGFVG